MANFRGMGAAGCPVISGSGANSWCNVGGQEVPCTMVRECDSMTGATHFEYAVGVSPNVNITEVAADTGRVVGYQDQNARFTTDSPIQVGTQIVNPQGQTVYVPPPPPAGQTSAPVTQGSQPAQASQQVAQSNAPNASAVVLSSANPSSWFSSIPLWGWLAIGGGALYAFSGARK